MQNVLQSTHSSISINYSHMLASFLPSSIPFVSKQAISKARQGISHEAFMELFRLSVSRFYQSCHNRSAWNGFQVYTVDGSSIQIPESDENSLVFGGNPNKTGKLSPLASISVLYDILNDILVDVSLHPYRYNERKAAKEHMKFLQDLSNVTILFDRGYPSEEMFRFLHTRGIQFLMRVPKTFKKAVFHK